MKFRSKHTTTSGIKLFSALLLALVTCVGLTRQVAGASFQEMDVAGMHVAMWLPDAPLNKNPVIIFSHAFHGCNTQSTFLMEALANNGYAVFAPNHKDAACRQIGKWATPPDVPFEDAEHWNDTTYADRGEDIHKLLDMLEEDPHFFALDWQRVGLAGHSLGGYTALAIAGAWPQWKDTRIKAILALSPYSAPFVVHRTLEGIKVPVMYQAGTQDFMTPVISKHDGAYDQTTSPKIYMELDGAGHISYLDIRPSYRETINAYSIAFFDHYLGGKPFPQNLTVTHDQVSKVWTSGM